MVWIFLTKLLKCTDISNDDTMIALMTKIMEEVPLTAEEGKKLSELANDTIKDGIATSSISLIGPQDINSLDELVGNMIIINEDGTYRYADDYDISLFFNIPLFDGIPCSYTVGAGVKEFTEI